VPSPLVGEGGPKGRMGGGVGLGSAKLRIAGAIGSAPLTRPSGTRSPHGARGTAGRACGAASAKNKVRPAVVLSRAYTPMDGAGCSRKAGPFA
jgi:hypothetical protein